MKRKFNKINTVLLLLIIFIFIGGNSYAEQVKKRKILVLHSYHIGLSWTEKIINGIKSTLSKAKSNGLRFEIDYEYMDTKRFVDKSYYKMLYNVYKHKSKKLKYDVIISADDNALNFLLQYRDELFGEVPVVFCGVNFFTDSRIAGHKLYTGVVEAFDVKDTVEIALELHPNTKEFVVIGDSSTSAKKNKLAVEKVAPLFKEKNISFKYLNDAHIERYRKELGLLKEGSIVLAMLFNRDNTGKFYTYEDSFRIYTADVKVPVYTFWDFYLGHGALGGMIISGNAQGEAAAEMALRILMCEKVEDIPVLRESPNRYMFDYNYFAKFGIDLSDIPFDSIVLNKPRSYMDALWTYRELILIIFVIIAFLISVIVILSMNILKRKKVEAKLSKTNIAYNRFVPHEFLFNLKKDDIIDVELGDQVEREMTILFSDIRSFTTLSESMTPEENFNFLNSYLKIVSPVIRDHEGFIDKYIGDAIMAIFPEVPEDAVAAAVEMQRQVIEYNIGRKEAGYPPIRIGIGLHFGGLMLGTVGEEQRMEGTVISDAVNLASRLEGLTKLFGAGIIISEQVLEALGERKLKYNYRFLGKVQVKGKTGAVQIYEIIDGNIAGIVERKLKTKSIFEKGLASYHGRDFAKAQERFKNVIKLDQKDKAAALYLERSVFYLNNEIPNNWDGVEKLDNK